MTLTRHIAGGTVSSVGVYAATSSVEAAVCCLFVSVAWDFDHFADFALWGDRRFSVKYFFEWCYGVRTPRFLLFLHSWELAIALALSLFFTHGALWCGAVAGVLTHMTLDEIGNRKPVNGFGPVPYFYFFFLRLHHGFRRERLLRPS